MSIGKHILIIDDEASVIEPLSELLTDAGYAVSTATNAGLGAARAQFFDCVILDLQLSAMYPMEGGSVLSHLWEDQWCTVPIIVYSGLLGIQEVDETLKQIETVCGKGRNIFRCIPKSQGVIPLLDAVNDCLRSTPTN